MTSSGWFPGARTPGGRKFRREQGRIYLRHPRRGDFEAWSQLRSVSKEFLQPWEPRWSAISTTRRSYKARLARIRQEARDGTGLACFIFRAEDDALLGGINLINVRRGVVQAASLGYWIGAPHARQGYMTDALSAIISIAFNDLDLHRLDAACLPGNTPSVALLERAGFQQEGTARQNIRIDGAWRDHGMFGLVGPEKIMNSKG